MDGKFSVDVMGEQGAMIMFEFMMGEGDEAMMYMTASDPGEVMVGMPGVPKIASLMAQGDGMMMTPKPTAGPERPGATPHVPPVMPGKTVEQIVDEAIAEAMAAAMESMPCPRTARTAATGRMAKTALTALTDATAPTVLTALTAPTALTGRTAPRATPAPPVPPDLRDPVVLPAPRVQAAGAESSPSLP